MSEFEFCQVERDERLLIVTLNRPEVRNALHPPAHEELARVFDDFRDDPELWVAIVTGAGDQAFSAGNDLKFQAAGGRLAIPPSGFGGLTSRFDTPKPILAAVNGFAYGGGCEIALACDLVIAAENATFALPEPRVGMIALTGGLHRLARQIPLKHAMGMVLTGRRVGAHEAERLGIVNEVVPEGQALSGARRWAEQILEASPVCVQGSKEIMLQGLQKASLEEAMGARYEAVRRLFTSEDVKEGPRAFAEKRKPRWTGR